MQTRPAKEPNTEDTIVKNISNFLGINRKIEEEGIAFVAGNLGKVKKGNVELIRKIISDWTARAQEWKEFDELKKTESELRRVHQNLNDEIAVISLRHVLPGRCKYCPL